MNGSWVLQPQGSVIPSDLGPTTTLAKIYLQDNFTASNTPATINSLVSVRIEQLNLSPTAIFLCLSILIFLMLATILILGSHKHYLGLLPRDVDTIGSILGFVYASERLLQRSNEPLNSAPGAENEIVRMGWFESRGKRRWGIEILDKSPEPPKPVKVPKPPKQRKERKVKVKVKDRSKELERVETSPGYPTPVSGMERGYEEVDPDVYYGVRAWELRPARAERWA